VLPTKGGGRILQEGGCSASAFKGLLNLVLLDRIAGIRSKHVHSVPSLARPMPFGRLRRSFVGSAPGVKYNQTKPNQAGRPVKRGRRRRPRKRAQVQAFPCRSCVTLAMKEEGHECVSQDNMHYSTDFLLRVICSCSLDGVACWDCSEAGHPRPTVSK